MKRRRPFVPVLHGLRILLAGPGAARRWVQGLISSITVAFWVRVLYK